MKPPDIVRIVPADFSHVGQIAALARSYRLSDMPSHRAHELGFLVSDFGEVQYNDLVGRANHFYVMLQKDFALGFVLAYSSDRIQSDEWLNLHIREWHPELFVLIKQICIRQDVTGQSLASRLYQHVFKQAPHTPLFAAVVLDPPNTRSIAFHEKLGFRQIAAVRCPDGILRAVWMRPAPSTSP